MHRLWKLQSAEKTSCHNNLWWRTQSQVVRQVSLYIATTIYCCPRYSTRATPVSKSVVCMQLSPSNTGLYSRCIWEVSSGVSCVRNYVAFIRDTVCNPTGTVRPGMLTLFTHLRANMMAPSVLLSLVSQIRSVAHNVMKPHIWIGLSKYPNDPLPR